MKSRKGYSLWWPIWEGSTRKGVPPPPCEEFITKFTSSLIPYTCNMNYWAFIMSEVFFGFWMRYEDFLKKISCWWCCFCFVFFSGTVIHEQSKCPTNVSISIQFCLVDISVSSLWIVCCKHQQKQEKCINIYFVESENRDLWVLASVYRFPLSLCLERRVVGHAISLSELEFRRALCL